MFLVALKGDNSINNTFTLLSFYYGSYNNKQTRQRMAYYEFRMYRARSVGEGKLGRHGETTRLNEKNYTIRDRYNTILSATADKF